MIRPDGKPHHPEDGWDKDGFPLTFATAPRVEVSEFAKSITRPWGDLIVDHRVFQRKTDASLWSPVILSSTARKSLSVSHITALVYDFDHGEKWEDVIPVAEMFKIRFWAYSTYRNTEEEHRFRLVLAVDEAIPADLYPKVWKGFARTLGWHIDEQCKDLARMYYVPSCPPGATAWQDWGAGSGINWRSWLEVWEANDCLVQEPRPFTTAKRRDWSIDVDREAKRRASLKMLEEVPPSCGMSPWWELCCGITDALGREGFAMVKAWSQRCPEKFNSREWQSMERRFNV